jgi:hypothetical protein
MGIQGSHKFLLNFFFFLRVIRSQPLKAESSKINIPPSSFPDLTPLLSTTSKMQANIDYFLTGYTDLRHSQVNLVNSPTSEEAPSSANLLTALLDQYMDTTQCAYLDSSEKLEGPSRIPQEESISGLQGSKLLSQLPWITLWPIFLQASEPVKVFYINGICNICADGGIGVDKSSAEQLY